MPYAKLAGWIAIGWLALLPYATAGAESQGAYQVAIDQAEDAEAAVAVTPVGGQAALSRGPEHGHPTAHARCTAEAEENFAGFLIGTMIRACFEGLVAVGDYGLYGGWGPAVSPLPTRMSSADSLLWEGRPLSLATNLGLALDLPVTEALDLEMYLGGAWGSSSREKHTPDGWARESIRLGEFHYGVRVVCVVPDPFFLSCGLGGAVRSTTATLETNLASFHYEGYWLEEAHLAEFSLGCGAVTPPDWWFRMRAGLEAYYQGADFGGGWGLRLTSTWLLSNQRGAPEIP